MLGTGFENLENAWQVTLVAPLALGLAAILVVPESGPFVVRDTISGCVHDDRDDVLRGRAPDAPRGRAHRVVRRGWRVAIGTAAVPAAAYVVWYLAYGRDSPEVAVAAPRAVPRFVWDGITDALGDVARLEVIGVVVVVGVAGWLVVQLLRRPINRDLTVPVALAIGGVAFLVGTGYRRGNLIGSDPSASRYTYVTVAFVLPLIALASQSLFRGSTWRRVVLVLLTVVLVVAQVRKLDHQADLARPGKDSDRGAVLATAALAREGRTFLLDRPLNAFEPQVTVDKIVQMDHDGKLPPAQRCHDRRSPHRARPARPLRRPRSDRARQQSGADRVGTPRRPAPAPTAASPAPRATATSSCCASPAPGRFASAATACSASACATPRAAEGEVVASVLPPEREQVVSTSLTDGRLVVTLPTDHPTVFCDVVQ